MLKIWNGLQWVQGVPANGDLVREYVLVGTSNEHYREFTYVEDALELTTYYTANESLSVGGTPSTGFNNTYYGNTSSPIVITAEIVDSNGDLQTQINNASLGFPPDYILKMPITKFINGIEGDTVDEVYFNVVFLDGVMEATGSLPSGGDWKVVAERVNKALLVVGANFKISRDNITILV